MERDAVRQAAEMSMRMLEQRQKAAMLLEQHPQMLKLLELETYGEIAKSANARIYLGIDRPREAQSMPDE
jgi:hypothetical protein